jgi:hypothetical protein
LKWLRPPWHSSLEVTYSRVAEEEGLPYRRNTEASRLRRTANRKIAEVCDLGDAWSSEMAEDRDEKSAAEVREKKRRRSGGDLGVAASTLPSWRRSATR